MSDQCRKLLLVNKDAHFNDYAMGKLYSQGTKIVSALSGKEALDALKADDYGFVVIDEHLPDIKSAALIKKMKPLLPKECLFITLSQKKRKPQLNNTPFLEADLDIEKDDEMHFLEHIKKVIETGKIEKKITQPMFRRPSAKLKRKIEIEE
ncbi:MAG: hypothetical protein Tsb0021_10580 [Chlamydiales bacterium]